MKLAIVAIGFNRVNSLDRLLKSLSRTNYGHDLVDLIISIDCSGSNDVETLAVQFHWKFGNKIIKTYPTRLGLREHVLSCSKFLEEFDALAVFEDDIFVSPEFYNFMKQAVEYYADDENIAGISFYSHHWSEYNSRPFVPMKNNYDVYFMQFAQSWGQIWMKKQWQLFKEWYDKNSDNDVSHPTIPRNVSNWPKTSWLKYHIKYCVENDKYFVYPYTSLCTNFTDIGNHNDSITTTYQVPMSYGSFKNYHFCHFTRDNDIVSYDSYFEREGLGKHLNLDDNNVCVDLYGGKHRALYKKYLLTMEKHPFRIINSYALSLRPHEMNIIYGVPGDEIFLYDTSVKHKKMPNGDVEIRKWHYDVKMVNYKVIIKLLMMKLKSKMTLKEICLSVKYRVNKLMKRNLL